MAKEAWCTVAPTSGNGNKTIAISASAHTGRTARSTMVTVQNKNGAKPSKTVTINQAEKELFITKDSGPTPASIPAMGGVIVITGKSNAKMINLFEMSDCMSAHEFKANGVMQADSNNDFTYPQFVITGDPGATNEYTFESKVTIPENPYAEPRQIEILFKGCLEAPDEMNAARFTVVIPQDGTISIISTDKSTLSLASAGTVQNIEVTSNDSWGIS